MRNKGAIVALTVIITALCLYYLSFTWVSNNVQQQATTYATEQSGTVNFAKKQQFLDSVWNEPVMFGFTLKEIKETELSLGLDLQGGMHVTLEVSPSAIIEGLSGNNQDPKFKKAIAEAKEMQKNSQKPFIDLFYSAWEDVAPGEKLSSIFATSSNKGKVSFNSSDAEVLKFINTEIDDSIERAFNILRTRIDRFGTTQPNIQRLQGTGRIQIELPGVDNPERVRKLLQGVAKLEFWEVYEPQEYFPSLQAVNEKLVSELEMEAIKAEETGSETSGTVTSNANDLAALTGGDSTAVDTTATATEADSALNAQVSPIFALLKSPYGLAYDVKDTSKINRILNRSDIKTLLPKNLKFLWEVKPSTLDNGDEILNLYAIKVGRNGKAPLGGDVITRANNDFDQTGAPAVSMQMNAVGAKKWRKITGENINRRIAIVLDDYVYSAPVVNGEIPNGSSQISGNFTIEEAKDLANILKSGSLPAPTRIVEEAIIGPTLGKEAQQQGIISVFLGLGLVVVFMLAYYAKGGLVANIALVFNIFFILGILAQLNAALTLPGIAGIVLTIGMSIDANVLIFERIREELRNGAGLKKAIEAGYDKAFSSIIDANVTTFLVGAILYTLGQGPVKGFAITLMIGIASSFFSAVFITRVIVDAMTKKGDASKLPVSMPWSKNFLVNANINFLGRRTKAYIFSAAVIIIGGGLVAYEGGLNLGVDFTGGRSYVVKFDQAYPASDLKIALTKEFSKGTEVKTFGANNVLKITTSYMINDESDSADEAVKGKLILGIQNATGEKFQADDTKLGKDQFTIISSSKVGATIADDIKSTSLEAGFFALIAIFLYILLRFRKWQYSAGAIVALAHDILFVISAFAIARLAGFAFEVDQVFVAAVLTIVGYSINDTVVVFDRIREELKNSSATADKESVFNKAINNTISRTIITSFTTFIVVLVLFLFGGEVLRGFSFAMLIGILVGTYSSIFIATPVVIDLDKRNEKAKA
ncbi:protein translocase subunit SecDF [Aureibacter tunicatorum]|uniref:Multifunctional fusion protein n=1 Tax=Aureibacter tunicatorum TaxID=866807 RepID=A0AAE3XND0_9BACT|nr:protein translocase subunit SecDF [Aureibacter tunicatorum]MDR6240137.1 SecD/SecF fusion protein [Aureibacter tunicatorum]BDD05982.1 protein translocase subunit SecDF [Aureibacter tunicatorum]